MCDPSLTSVKCYNFPDKMNPDLPFRTEEKCCLLTWRVICITDERHNWPIRQLVYLLKTMQGLQSSMLIQICVRSSSVNTCKECILYAQRMGSEYVPIKIGWKLAVLGSAPEQG